MQNCRLKEKFLKALLNGTSDKVLKWYLLLFNENMLEKFRRDCLGCLEESTKKDYKARVMEFLNEYEEINDLTCRMNSEDIISNLSSRQKIVSIDKFQKTVAAIKKLKLILGIEEDINEALLNCYKKSLEKFRERQENVTVEELVKKDANRRIEPSDLLNMKNATKSEDEVVAINLAILSFNFSARTCEILKVAKDEVMVESGTVHIKFKQTKTMIRSLLKTSECTCDYKNAVIKALCPLEALKTLNSLNPDSQRLSKFGINGNGYRTVLHKIGERIGISRSDFKIHQLRGMLPTELNRKGHNVEEIMTLGPWKSGAVWNYMSKTERAVAIKRKIAE